MIMPIRIVFINHMLHNYIIMHVLKFHCLCTYLILVLIIRHVVTDFIPCCNQQITNANILRGKSCLYFPAGSGKKARVSGLTI